MNSAHFSFDECLKSSLEFQFKHFPHAQAECDKNSPINLKVRRSSTKHRDSA